ncbi:TonB-dependent receptor [Elizabethkingia meningoseptica]|uniref:TonB-dependent receptor n=1 Tax=Elizabethkingia meningoseptica TaxID=238 RepID=UPI000332C225|nr:TonB-dependent receptor plug domain-containing protein [Elizabethkingia meningoseptica]AQX06185.1 TonB-dependent receptor [Elizabethkingia meningoseptica]AQX48232.1 TonB-dependent receptor [Elizabethkingia meningoseptica]EOR28921.1 TonB-dependent receptor plug [Elizabethkingia meningoseptica ATCC 13253 = NBRC 12535]KUY23418.1 TonB-dependent receptor [Elizabethkingia meningoseptica]OPB71566.1 TonB-dependent receptor [Elizabethkingia meningoseptica]
MVNNDRFPVVKFLFFSFLFFIAGTISTKSQDKLARLSFEVKDHNGKPVGASEISVSSAEQLYKAYSDNQGTAVLNVLPGTYKVEVHKASYPGYSGKITVTGSTNINISLTEKISNIEEVVLTAKEGKGLTSSSIIDQRAMRHLQPSSFTDLLELLPGGRSKDPVFNQTNKIRLREVGAISNDYNTSSMGTTFLINGAPLNSGANLQYTYASLDGIRSGLNNRLNITSGVDMRSISTDQIEKVEVLRGIPSVIYGNLTSGIVKITNKSGYTKWRSRFKADGYSKLFAISKGFENKNQDLKINTGLDYLDAKSDPRDRRENYKRITANLAVAKEIKKENGSIKWQSNLSYTGSLDGSKTDPDVDLSALNSYEVNNHLISFSNQFTYTRTKPSFYRETEVQITANQRFDKIKQTKFVQLENATAFPISRVEGEYDGYYPEAKYISDYTVDGKPLDLFVKMINHFQFDYKSFKNEINAGFDWQLSKNWGQGQLFDVYKPIDPKATFRPRAYRDIPAYTTSALFLESISTLDLGQHRLTMALGLRGNTMMNLPAHFKMHGKIYTDPRANLQWELPSFELLNKKTKIDLTLGYGKQRLFPDLNMLYPELFYKDVQQLNYFHDNKAYRRVYYKTMIYNLQNPDLEPAVNEKFEARVDVALGLHQLSVTVFRENMRNAFRSMNQFGTYNYKRYDASGINHDAINAPPDVNALPYQVIQENFLYSTQQNGSRIDKEGIEFQYSSNRIPVINTRFTFNGAWFRTKYENSVPMYRSRGLAIGGRPYPYIGLYEGMEPKSINEMLNTNLMLDTYIPRLDLIFSSSFQFAWYTARKTLPMNGVPSYYIDQTGQVFPFDPEKAKGTLLESLIFPQQDDAYSSSRVPMQMSLNLKVSKSFRNRAIVISMFANRLFSYEAPYWVNGIRINRKGINDPYFGMEVNFSL